MVVTEQNKKDLMERLRKWEEQIPKASVWINNKSGNAYLVGCVAVDQGSWDINVVYCMILEEREPEVVWIREANDFTAKFTRKDQA